MIDDGSQDGSAAICDEYAEKDDRILVIHQENAGVSAARNAGLEAATGEYIAFVDSDDWIAPDMYEIMLQDIERNHADCVFCGYTIVQDCEEKAGLPKKAGLVSRVEALEQSLLATPDRSGYQGYLWNKMVRKAVIGTTRLDSSITMCEDLNFTIEVLMNCQTVFLNPKPLYFYYQRIGSACHTRHLGITRQRKDNIYSRELLLRKLEKYPCLCKQVKADLFQNAVRVLVDSYLLKEKAVLKEMKPKARHCFFAYLLINNISLKRKLYTVCLYLAVRLHLPVNILSKVSRWI